MRAFLVSGIPGAGKTTVSRLLATRFPRAAHIEGDVLSFDFVVSGQANPFGTAADAAEFSEQMELRRRHICLLADSFAAAGFLPVMDDVVVSPSTLDLYQQLLRTRPLHLVILAPHLNVVAERDAARHKQVFELWKHLDIELRTTMAGTGLWLDTSHQDPEQTVDFILSHLDNAVVHR